MYFIRYDISWILYQCTATRCAYLRGLYASVLMKKETIYFTEFTEATKKKKKGKVDKKEKDKSLIDVVKN